MAEFLQVSPNKLVFRLELGQQSGCSITLQVRQAAVPGVLSIAAQRGAPHQPAMDHCRCGPPAPPPADSNPSLDTAGTAEPH